MNNSEKEIWLPISRKKYRQFEVSSLGRVRRIPDSIRHNYIPMDTVVVPPRTDNSLPSVRVVINSKGYGKYGNISLRRLVAEAFIPNPLRYRYVDYIDGDYTNCRMDNLEWACYVGDKLASRLAKSNTYPTIPGEVWKTIPYFPWSRYQVSNMGRLRNRYKNIMEATWLTYRNENRLSKTNAILREVALDKDGRFSKMKGTTVNVGVLTAAMFVPNPQGHSRILFKNWDTTDHTASNLEWVSSAYNYKRENSLAGIRVVHDIYPKDTEIIIEICQRTMDENQ